MSNLAQIDNTATGKNDAVMTDPPAVDPFDEATDAIADHGILAAIPEPEVTTGEMPAVTTDDLDLI